MFNLLGTPGGRGASDQETLSRHAPHSRKGPNPSTGDINFRSSPGGAGARAHMRAVHDLAQAQAQGPALLEPAAGSSKRAFRRQAKKHHPDQGRRCGPFPQTARLRAADPLSENPTFTTRRGFTDKWFYEGGLDRWTQPPSAQHPRRERIRVVWIFRLAVLRQTPATHHPNAYLGNTRALVRTERTSFGISGPGNRFDFGWECGKSASRPLDLRLGQPYVQTLAGDVRSGLMSPSRRAAIGPWPLLPAKCGPMAEPRLAPEKRPS